MVEIKCKAKDTILLSELSPFQGNLKKRTQSDIDGLKASLTREGLLMPFAVWKKDDKNYLLDGHGRLEALLQLSMEQQDILTTKMPCIYIDAATEDDARKTLLQITSSYGKITKKGAEAFMISIPDYVAPAVKKFVSNPVPKKTVEVKDSTPVSKLSILKIRVPTDMKDSIVKMLQDTGYIEVL